MERENSNPTIAFYSPCKHKYNSYCYIKIIFKLCPRIFKYIIYKMFYYIRNKN